MMMATETEEPGIRVREDEMPALEENLAPKADDAE
jgi:hypothetical protein